MPGSQEVKKGARERERMKKRRNVRKTEWSKCSCSRVKISPSDPPAASVVHVVLKRNEHVVLVSVADIRWMSKKWNGERKKQKRKWMKIFHRW